MHLINYYVNTNQRTESYVYAEKTLRCEDLKLLHNINFYYTLLLQFYYTILLHNITQYYYNFTTTYNYYTILQLTTYYNLLTYLLQLTYLLTTTYNYYTILQLTTTTQY